MFYSSCCLSCFLAEKNFFLGSFCFSQKKTWREIRIKSVKCKMTDLKWQVFMRFEMYLKFLSSVWIDFIWYVYLGLNFHFNLSLFFSQSIPFKDSSSVLISNSSNLIKILIQNTINSNQICKIKWYYFCFENFFIWIRWSSLFFYCK